MFDGKISLQLKKVTIPEVLDTIRNVYGYDFKRTPQGIELLTQPYFKPVLFL